MRFRRLSKTQNETAEEKSPHTRESIRGGRGWPYLCVRTRIGDSVVMNQLTKVSREDDFPHYLGLGLGPGLLVAETSYAPRGIILVEGEAKVDYKLESSD